MGTYLALCCVLLLAVTCQAARIPDFELGKIISKAFEAAPSFPDAYEVITSDLKSSSVGPAWQQESN